MQENRQNPRVRSYLRGEIVHSGGAIRLECTIRDLSSDGARLQISRGITLPDPFELHIPQRNSVERARIVWRHGDETGVHFERIRTGPVELAPVASAERSVLARVDALENEVTNLRRQLALIRSQLDRITIERG